MAQDSVPAGNNWAGHTMKEARSTVLVLYNGLEYDENYAAAIQQLVAGFDLGCSKCSIQPIVLVTIVPTSYNQKATNAGNFDNLFLASSVIHCSMLSSCPVSCSSSSFIVWNAR